MSLQQMMARFDMLRFGRRLGVAVSGGADSVFLLRVLHATGLAAGVLHVNHQLRGGESDGDAAFVRSLAAELGLPVVVATIPVGEGNVEQEARRGRYRFFSDQIAAGFCDAVATGHTLDDQAETVVSRFLRGAGTAGLSGIRPVTGDRMVRPLLEVRRDDIRAWLGERGHPWREDSSNQEQAFLRNRIRLDLLPHLAEFNPALPQVLASTAEWAQGEEEFWDAETSRHCAEMVEQRGEIALLRTGDLLARPVAVQRRVLRKAVEMVKGSLRSIDFRHIEAIRALTMTAEGSGRIQLPELDIYRSFDWLRLAPIGIDSRLERNFEVPLEVPGLTLVPERGLTIGMELVSPLGVYNDEESVLDWSRCAGGLVLRNWQPGDSYRRAGKSGAEKIKSLFQEFRIPLWERRSWPVIAKGQEILWTRRFGPAAEYVPGPECEQLLRIREGGESNRVVSASNVLCGSS